MPKIGKAEIIFLKIPAFSEVARKDAAQIKPPNALRISGIIL